MALSNWDRFAFNEAGELCDGKFVSFNKHIIVSIYKNWIYIDVKGREYPFELTEGQIRLDSVYITARRGPQNGVYVVVQETDYEPTRFHAMVGCGVYGYSNVDSEWVGTIEESKDFLRAMMDEKVEADWDGISLETKTQMISEDPDWEFDFTFDKTIRNISIKD